MSDDTREHTLESVARRQISADDPTLDALTTITIRVEKEGEWFELEFKSKSEDVEEVIESFTPAEMLDGYPPAWPAHREAMVKAWPGKRINKFTLNAIPVADPVTGVLYVKRTRPPEG